MLIAEIRRKLPNIEDIDAVGPDALAQIRGLLRETKEDLLTADVFGVLKYLPRHPYLEAVFETLASRNAESREFQAALPQLRQRVRELTFQFWPNYPTPAGLTGGRTEPDVVIADDQILLLFEAKLGSAFGDRQLERELAVAACEAKGRDFFLVLVTPGSKPPRFRHGTARLCAADYLAAFAASDDCPAEARSLLSANGNRVLWISWEAIVKALNEAHEQHRAVASDQGEGILRAADMLCDLNALMLLRQIRPFTGFDSLRELAPHTNRPIVLQAPSIQARDLYELAQVTREVPVTFGWRCPSTPFSETSGGFIPIGTCCESWDLSSEKSIPWLLKGATRSGESWDLTSRLRRWSSLSGVSGLSIPRTAGQSAGKVQTTNEIEMFGLYSLARHRDLPVGKSGFEIKRRKQ